MPLTDKLRNQSLRTSKARKGPLWRGPEADGVTFSLLSRFLCCRERFRLLVVEGLRAADTFNAKLEFGQMWHTCEEHLAGLDRAGGASWMNEPSTLVDYVAELNRRYPMDREKVAEWYGKCRTLFPLYVAHWRDHPDVRDRTPLLQEQVFDVPYKLPSGRTVRLRGKWDSVDLIGKGKAAGVYLQENKTKRTIDGVKLRRQLTFDLQTMMYLVALVETDKQIGTPLSKYVPNLTPVRGVRYNVVRRALHKTPESMLKKFEEDRAAGRIDEWFARYKVEVTPGDVLKFRRETLDPILEQLCDWWDWVKGNPDPFDYVNDPSNAPHAHWRHPFGVYNVLDEGGSSDVDAYLESGSEVGLQRTDDLFPELKQGA